MPFDDVWGEAFHDVARRHAGGVLLGAICEDLPQVDNRVTLHPTLTDSSGIPVPKVTYRLSQNTRRMLSYANDRLVEAHDAMGATRTFRVDLWEDQPGHLLGTRAWEPTH